jgi:hypothetical protein
MMSQQHVEVDRDNLVETRAKRAHPAGLRNDQRTNQECK